MIKHLMETGVYFGRNVIYNSNKDDGNGPILNYVNKIYNYLKTIDTNLDCHPFSHTKKKHN